jgi:hypothetical protein
MAFKRTLEIVTMTLALAGSAYGQQPSGWLCAADKSTGFKYNRDAGTWNTTEINVEGTKYIIRRPTQYDIDAWKETKYFGVLSGKNKTDRSETGKEYPKWGLQVMGGAPTLIPCTSDVVNEGYRGVVVKQEYVKCESQGLVFNGEDRYQIFNGSGYIDSWKYVGQEAPLMPHIEIGRCSPF